MQHDLVHVAGRGHRVQGERASVAAKRALTERAVITLRHVQALHPQATLMTRATRVHSHDPLLVALIGRVENVSGHVRGRLIRDLPHAVRRRSRVVAVRASSNGLTVLVGHATHATVHVVVNPQLLASLHVGVKLVRRGHRNLIRLLLRVSGTNLTHMVARLDSVHASRSERRTNSESRQRRASHATGTHLTRILHLCQKAHLSSHSAAQSATETTCHPARAHPHSRNKRNRTAGARTETK